MPTATTHIGDFEDFLGPSEGRFFGAGFKRVTQRLTSVRIGPDEQGRSLISAKASVAYPRDWSRKSRTEDLRPHLSSIDALVLAVQLAEAYLTQVFGLDDAQRGGMWVRRLDMRANAKPQEDLSQFDARALLVRTVLADPAADGGALAGRGADTADTPDTAEVLAVSTLACTIGTIIVQCEIAHPRAMTVTHTGQHGCLEDLLGNGDRRYYGNGYKRRGHLVKGVEIDPDHLWARAEVQVLPDASGDSTAVGLGACYQPTASMVDFLISIAQLAQVLLYRTDQMSRGVSNTLWMRRVVMTARTPRLPMHSDVELRTAKSRLVDLDGRIWRIMDATSDVPGLHIWSSCAHELPKLSA